MGWVARVTAVLLLGTGLTAWAGTPAQAAATTCPTTSPQLVNGGFESPVVRPGFPRKVAQQDVPGWLFTEATMEIWPPGVTETPPGSSVPYAAEEGAQFLELNGNHPDGVGQPVRTQPAAMLLYELYHRGRTVTDTAELRFGVPGAAGTSAETLTDGPDAWGRYDGAYVVPAGQTLTSVRLVSITGSGPNNSIGNFIDGVRLAAAGCVQLTKSITDLTRSAGPPQVADVLEVRIGVHNTGDAAARSTHVLDDVPVGTDYVPGSLRILTGPDAGPQTDAADADRGQVSGAGQVRFDVGVGTQDDLGPDREATVSFRVRVTGDAAAHTIANTATATYRVVDLAGATLPGQSAATSNTVTLGPVPSPSPSVSPSPGPTAVSSDAGAAAELPATGPPDLVAYACLTSLLLTAGLLLLWAANLAKGVRQRR